MFLLAFACFVHSAFDHSAFEFHHSGHLANQDGPEFVFQRKSWGSQRNESEESPKDWRKSEPTVCHQVQRTQVRPISMFKVRGPELLRSGTKWEQCQEYSKKTSLAVQWLRFHVPELEGHGFSWSGKIPHEAQYDQKKKKRRIQQGRSWLIAANGSGVCLAFMDHWPDGKWEDPGT